MFFRAVLSSYLASTFLQHLTPTPITMDGQVPRWSAVHQIIVFFKSFIKPTTRFSNIKWTTIQRYPVYKPILASYKPFLMLGATSLPNTPVPVGRCQKRAANFPRAEGTASTSKCLATFFELCCHLWR